MLQKAVITFDTISKGKIPVSVATYDAPVLINALLRHTQWDMEQMVVEEAGPSRLFTQGIRAALDRIQQQDQTKCMPTRVVLMAALDEIAEICKEEDE